jgi:phosphatidylinositol alpha-1,6-mannosyltransferase
MGGWDVEGLGIVFLEGSATGLPVIVGNSGGAVDAVIDGETGFLIDGNDLSQIIDRITQVLSKPELAKQMGTAGRSWVTQQWTWEHSFNRLDSLLSGVDPD